jgi:hypothetical protein
MLENYVSTTINRPSKTNNQFNTATFLVVKDVKQIILITTVMSWLSYQIGIYFVIFIFQKVPVQEMTYRR